MAEIDFVETGRMHERGKHRVDAREQVEIKACDFFRKPLEVPGVRDQYVVAALGHHGQAIPFQRKDVIERQRRNSDDWLDTGIRISLPKRYAGTALFT